MFRKISKLQRKILDYMYIVVWTHKKRNICNEEYLYDSRIPFIYISSSRLAISGYINTIDGYYEQYVISVYDVLNKIKIRYQLKQEIKKRKIRKRNNNLFILLIQWANIPNELNNKILNFLNNTSI